MAKKKGKEKEEIVAVPQIIEEVKHDDVPQLIKHIRITLQGYMNITPLFSFSDLTVEANFMENYLGCSSKTQVIDEDSFPAHYEFVVECDINSPKSLDNLVSNPVMFTENPGQVDAELLARLGSSPKLYGDYGLRMSTESVVDLAEAFTGKTVDKSEFKSAAKASKASQIDSKASVKAKNSKDSKVGKEKKSIDKEKKSIDKEKKSTVDFTVEPVQIGTASLDLLPLFLGKAKFTETLLLSQSEKFFDDSMVPKNIAPRIIVEVSIDEDTWLEDNPNTNVINLTIESVYNIPTLMSDSMQYKASMLLPSAFGKWEPVVISGGKLKDNKVEMYRLKKWPGLQQAAPLKGFTKYRIDECYDTVKNEIDVNLDILKSEQPRVEWNILKRNFMMEEASRELLKRLKKYRRLPLELYVTSAKNELAGADKDNVKSDTSSKSDKGKKNEKVPVVKKEHEDYLHLMTAVDVSTLLYPGVKRCRLICPLNTYQEMEILQQTGLTDSYFMPKQIEAIRPVSTADKKVVDKPKSKEGKGGKATAGDSNKTDLKSLLPPHTVIECVPSSPVYSENGERTFILIEIELLKPLVPKREIEDLSEELSHILPKRPVMSKAIVSSRLADLQFKEMLRQLTEDMVHQHQHYLLEKEQCKCNEDSGTPQMGFVTFLQRIGVYQTYLISVTKAASLIINDRFPFVGEASHSNKDYQNFIATVYTTLIKEMNSTLNELTCSGVETTSISPLKQLDPLLLYAREACEIGAHTLADRYHLERICQDDKNANCWFDYAVFQLEIGDKDKALECAQQCLLMNDKHSYSLLLCGILLSEQNLNEEAETCFLTAMFQKPGWLEGWGTLHLFYRHTGNSEGADLCLEMANKSIKDQFTEKDYFSSIDDLVWTAATCPDTIFFRTTVLLLKMRAFTFAEKALACEKIKTTGIYHYYLGIIMYYRRDYAHSLLHLQEAEQLYGLDYAIGSLKGHCLLAQENVDTAKEEYMKVVESFERPDDMHLLYIYLALISERLGDKQFARKLLLLVCKFSPTPYTWLAVGLNYYGQKDLLSAEQCLTQANMCDNRLPEVWGYLVLINLELQRYSEAELCYKQAKKNKIGNPAFAKKVDDAMKSYNKR